MVSGDKHVYCLVIYFAGDRLASSRIFVAVAGSIWKLRRIKFFRRTVLVPLVNCRNEHSFSLITTPNLLFREPGH